MRVLVLLLLTGCIIPLSPPEIRTDNPRRSVYVTPSGRIYAVYVDQPEVVRAACEDQQRSGCVKVWRGSRYGEVWMIDNRQVEDHECAHVAAFENIWTDKLIEHEIERHSIVLWGRGEPAREKPCQP